MNYHYFLKLLLCKKDESEEVSRSSTSKALVNSSVTKLGIKREGSKQVRGPSRQFNLFKFVKGVGEGCGEGEGAIQSCFN
jgi:hypothetical protein